MADNSSGILPMVLSMAWLLALPYNSVSNSVDSTRITEILDNTTSGDVLMLFYKYVGYSIKPQGDKFMLTIFHNGKIDCEASSSSEKAAKTMARKLINSRSMP